MDKLEFEKNLIIEDRDYAESILKRVSYFSLITGYKKLFKNPTTNKYNDTTAFEDIYALYKFDENLRGLFLKYLLQIEQAVGSMLSYYFVEKHGDMQSEYLSMSNYSQKLSRRNRQTLEELISKMRHIAIVSTNYAHICHHRNNYNNVPLWVLIRVFTFGNISKMYQCSTGDLQFKVSKNFNNVSERGLDRYLSVLTKFRNVCAHNDRLFSFRTRDDIPDTTIHQKLGITKHGRQYVYGKKDLFSIVIAFRHLLPRADFIEFKRGLSKAIDRFVVQTTNITHDELLCEMGFPENWKKVSSYKV